MVFENRMLRGIFGLKRDEVIGGCRKLHNKEQCDLYSRSRKLRLTTVGDLPR
jgi:hypothetical protein